MKDYEEMAKSVLSRRDNYVMERKKRMKKVVSIGSCFCLMLLVGVGIWHTQNSTLMNALPQTRIADEGGGIPSNLTMQNSNSERAVLLLAQQDVITELQKEFDEEVKKSAERSKNLEFQIQYPAIPLTDEEVLEILGEKNFYAYQLETLNEETLESYNPKDTWKTISFSNNDYKEVA